MHSSSTGSRKQEAGAFAKRKKNQVDSSQTASGEEISVLQRNEEWKGALEKSLEEGSGNPD